MTPEEFKKKDQEIYEQNKGCEGCIYNSLDFEMFEASAEMCGDCKRLMIGEYRKILPDRYQREEN